MATNGQDDDLALRLSQIETRWTELRAAQQSDAPRDEVVTAQEAFLERYREAVYRYLLSALPDHHAADELFAEFAMKLVRGQFRSADPRKGRFRSFLKATLFNLVSDWRRRNRRQASQLDVNELEIEDDSSDHIQLWHEAARHFLLDKAWRALKAESESDFLVLRGKGEGQSAAQLSATIKQQLGEDVSEQAVHKRAQRARDHFGRLLMAEVNALYGDLTAEEREEVLGELRLLKYCKT